MFLSLLILAFLQQDFATKCAQPGVLSCWGLDNQSGIYYAWATGTICDQTMAALGYKRYGFGLSRTPPGNATAVVQNGVCNFPVVDSLAHSGAGSLKFTVPSQSGADSSGFYSEPYTRNPFSYIAPGSPWGNVLWFQFYQRFSQEFLANMYVCLLGGCGGWKQAINFGDPPYGSSSSSIEVTINDGWQRGMPTMYGQQGYDDYGWQLNCKAPYPSPPCVYYKPDTWMEFTVRVEVLGASNAQTSRVQLWVDGVLVVDYPKARVAWGQVPGSGNGLGQFMLTPYHTKKDPAQVHPIANTWYDDVIVSTQPITMVGSTPMISAPVLSITP